MVPLDHGCPKTGPALGRGSTEAGCRETVRRNHRTAGAGVDRTKKPRSPQVQAAASELATEGLVLEAEGPVLAVEGPVLEAEGLVLEVEGPVLEAEGLVLEAEGPWLRAPGVVGSLEAGPHLDSDPRACRRRSSEACSVAVPVTVPVGEVDVVWARIVPLPILDWAKGGSAAPPQVAVGGPRERRADGSAPRTPTPKGDLVPAGAAGVETERGDSVWAP